MGQAKIIREYYSGKHCWPQAAITQININAS